MGKYNSKKVRTNITPAKTKKATVVVTSGEFDFEKVPPEGVIMDIPLEQLHADKNQPRTTFNRAKMQELIESIDANGLQQYPFVNFWKMENGKPHFVIKGGERRLRAHIILKKLTMCCVVLKELFDENYSDERELAQVAENGAREGQTVAEIVHTVKRIVAAERERMKHSGRSEHGSIQIALRKVEKAFGKKPGWAASYYQLGSLTEELLEMLNPGENDEPPLLAWGDAISLVVAPAERQKNILDEAMVKFHDKPTLRRTYIARIAREYRKASGQKVRGRKSEDKDRLLKYVVQLVNLSERSAEGRRSGEHLVHVAEMLDSMGKIEVDMLLSNLKIGLTGFSSILKIVQERRDGLYASLHA